MNKTKIIFTIFLIIAFLTGIYVILSNPFSESSKEKLDNMDSQTNETTTSTVDNGCPNLLIQKGNVLMLYNTNQPMEDGKNPIPFFNLDEYINYLEIQRSQGINCPVLYLQQENNTQGQDVYRMRPSPFDLQGGLPTMVNNNEKIPTQIIDASRENAPYNANNYSGFDPQGLHIGEYTNIDQIHDSTKNNQISDNPMDPNWAGVTYTQQMIDSGKYQENNVSRPILFTPHNTVFYPTVQGPTKNPVDIL
jgi:hypothetical protein